MENNVSKFITIRGRFDRNKDKGKPNNVMVLELSGTASLLMTEPQVIINEECETNLTAFLRDNVPMNTYVTIRRVIVDDISELFQNSKIVEKWKEKGRATLDITDKLHDEDGVLKIGSISLYDVFWDKSNCTYEYEYVEIYIHNGDMSK